MAQQVRNVTNIIINTAGTGGPPATTPVLSTGDPSTLNAGEVGVFQADGTRMTAGLAATATSFFLARGNDKGQGYYTTDLINVANLTPATSANVPMTTTIPTEQHDTIGYDGTSGSLEALNNNLYLVRMYIQELLTSSSDGAVIKHFQYKSDASAAQAEVAIGLAGSAIRNFSKEATKYVAFETRCNDAGVANSALTGTLTATNGSKTVVASVAINGNGQVVGDFWRAGLTTSDDVYKIVSMDTTAETMVLDRAYQGATATFAAIASETITAALGAAADWGIDMLGQPLAYSTGKFFYKVARWVVGLEDFGTSTSAQVAGASKGQGSGKEIADMEWFMAGFEGETYRMGEPAIYNFVGTADSTLDYATYNISFQDVSLVGFQNEVSPKLLVVAIPTTRNTGAGSPANCFTAGNGLAGVLNVLCSVTIAPALT